jgi:hypothetical protein
MILGGLGGFFYWRIKPPVYEAKAMIEVGIDYNRTASMDDITALRAFDEIRVLILADSTLNQVLEGVSSTLRDSEELMSVTDLRERIKVAQSSDGYILLVYASDPDTAREIASLWARVVLDELEQATFHAIRVGEYQNALFETHCKIKLIEIDKVNRALWACDWQQGDINPDALAAELLEEVQSTKGILPIFSFSLQQDSTSNENPIPWSRGWYVLGGAMIGFLVSTMLMIFVPWSETFRREDA